MNKHHSYPGTRIVDFACGASLCKVNLAASLYLAACRDAGDERTVREGDLIVCCRDNCDKFAHCTLVNLVHEMPVCGNVQIAIRKAGAGNPDAGYRDGRLANVHDGDAGSEEFSASFPLPLKACVMYKDCKANVIVAPMLPEMDDGRDGGGRRDEGPGRGDAGEDEVEKLND